MTQNKNPIQKKFATLAARAIFVCPISLLFAPKIAFLWQILYYFSGKAWALKMVILNTCNWTFDDTKQKSISKKVCKFGCQSCFCMSYFIAFCSKNSFFVPNLALIALGDSHHSQGGMKFATQISPLLNLNIFYPPASEASREVANFN